MKTFTKTIQSPRLVIFHDENADNPRLNDGSIGFFLTKEKHYYSPDSIDNPLYRLMLDTEQEATNVEEHIKLMKDAAHEMFMASAPKDGNNHDESLHVIDIYPITCYEHGNISYKLGKHEGFDYSCCGFYFVTAQGLEGGLFTKEKIEKTIRKELEIYSQFVNGEVYGFTLYDENGVVIEDAFGLYDVKDALKYLPDEWKNENFDDYLV